MKLSKCRALLGITLEGRRLTAALLTRAGDRLVVKQQSEGVLTLDPLKEKPELVGQEIRNLLDQAGIKETRCVVCVPLKWAMTTSTALPELDEADLASLLELQAEREFPFPPHDLARCVSRYTLPGGESHALIVAIAANHQAVLDKVFKAAGLRLASVTLGITSLAPPAAHSEMIALLINENSVDLAVCAGGGVAALRSLEEAVVPDGNGSAVDIDLVVRQLRISLGKLPAPLRSNLRVLRVLGADRYVQPCMEELAAAAAALGVEVERGAPLNGLEAAGLDLGQPMVAAAAAAQRLSEKESSFEFLPPRVSRLQRIAAQLSARGALWLGSAAAVTVVLVGGAFWYQHRTLSVLEAEWAEMRPSVQKVEALQDKIRQFRPWADDDVRSLGVLRELTEAFPESGDVWVQSIGITNRGTHFEVTVSASARTSSDRLRVSDKLLGMPGVENLTTGSVRGESPETFTMKFSWKGTSTNGV